MSYIKKLFIVIALLLCGKSISYSQNLVTNGSSEFEAFGDIVGWTEASGDWSRSANGGWSTVQDGSYHFFAGQTASAELYQDIDVSSYSAAIDAGVQAFYFFGYTRSYLDVQNDLSRIVVEYRNSGGTVLDTYDTGDQNQSGSSNNDPAGWLLLQDTRIAPVNTRTIRIRLISTRLHGSDNDGYYDNISIEPICVGGTTLLSTTSICEGENASLTLFDYSGSIQWQENTGSGWTDIGGGTTPQLVTATSANSPVDYRAEVTLGSCTDYSSVSTLTVAPPAVAGTQSVSATSICEGESGDVNLSGETGTIQWQRSIAGGAFTNFGTGLNTENFTPVPAEDPIVFRAVTTLGSCTDTTVTDTVRVFPAANGGTLVASPLTICEGEDVGLTLSGSSGIIEWQEKVNGGSWSAVGGTSATETVNPTYANSPVEYRAMLIAGSCVDSSNEVSITINEAAQGGTTSSPASSLCDGESTTIDLAGESGTIQWQVSYNGGAFSNFGTGLNSENITPTVANSPAAYRALVTLGGCQDYSDTTSLQIFPTPVGGNVNLSNSTICDSYGTNLNLTGYTGLIQWQHNYNGAGWVDFGSGSATETVAPSTVNSPAEYRAVLTAGSCSDISDIGTLTIEPNAIGGTAISSNRDICDGTTGEITLSGETGTIQWQENLANAGWTDVSGATTNTLSKTLTLANDTAKFRAITTLGICTDTSTIDYVHLYPNAVAPTPTLSGSSICEGDTSYAFVIGETGTIQWQENPNGAGWSDRTAINNPDTLSPSLADSPLELRLITNLGFCPDTSDAVTLTINPNAVAGTTTSSNRDICDGSTGEVVLAGETGTIQWQENLADAGWVDVAGETSNTLSKPLALVDDTAKFRAVVTLGMCSQVSNEDYIHLYPNAIAPTPTLSDLTICEGDSSFLSVTGETGTITWQENPAGGGWVDRTSITNPDTIIPSLAQSPLELRLITTLGFCPDTSDVVTLNVVSPPTPGMLSGPDSICNGDAATITLSGASGGTGLTWVKQNNGGGFNVFGNTSNSQNDSPLFSDSPTDYIAITDNGVCAVATDTLTVVTLQPNAGTLTISDDTICLGNSVTLDLTGSNGIVSWESSLNGGVYTNFDGNVTSTINNPVLGTVDYRAVVSYSICNEYSNVVSLDVITVPSAPSTPAGAAEYCENTSGDFTISAVTGATSYMWSTTGNATTTTGTGLSETIDFGTFGNARVEVSASNQCGTSATSSFVDITIHAEPIAQIINADSSICLGESMLLKGSETTGILSSQLTYEWLEDGSTVGNSINYTTSNAASYDFVVTNNGLCVDTANVPVAVTVIDVDADAGADFTVNLGESYTMAGTSNGAWTYSWSPTAELTDATTLTPTVTPTIETNYILTATSPEGCIDTSSVLIGVIGDIKIPNVFTPNGDGNYDEFQIFGLEASKSWKLTIFNRYGSVVHTQVNNYTPWNGMHNGKLLPMATYYYVLDVQDKGEEYSGTVSIIY